MREPALSRDWSVPPCRTPRCQSWADPKPKNTWTGYSAESRKWQGFGPSLPTRVQAPHSLSPFPTKKWVNAALNARPANRKQPACPYVPSPALIPQQGTRPDVRHKWSSEELESLILRKIRERTHGDTGIVVQAFRMFNDKAGGEITPAHFAGALNRMCQCELTELEIMSLFNRYDTDGGGTLDIFEFIEGLLKPIGCANTLMGSAATSQTEHSPSERYCGGEARTKIKPPPIARFPTGMSGELRTKPTSSIAPWPNPAFTPEVWNRHPNSHLLAHDGPYLKQHDQSPMAQTPCCHMSPAALKGLLESESLIQPHMPRAAYMDRTTQALRSLRSESFIQKIEDLREVVSFPFRSC